MDDWEVIFEPGAVIVVEGFWASSATPDLQVERYELAESLMRGSSCRRQ
jgi:hypothetical protein